MVVQSQGDDFGWSAWWQQPQVTQLVMAASSLNLTVGSTGKALDQFTIPYSVFSLLTGSIAHNFHSLSLSSAVSCFKHGLRCLATHPPAPSLVIYSHPSRPVPSAAYPERFPPHIPPSVLSIPTRHPRSIRGLSQNIFPPPPKGCLRGVKPLSKISSPSPFKERHKTRVKERRSLSYISFPLPYQGGDKGGGL